MALNHNRNEDEITLGHLPKDVHGNDAMVCKGSIQGRWTYERPINPIMWKLEMSLIQLDMSAKSHLEKKVTKHTLSMFCMYEQKTKNLISVDQIVD